ncbi:MAG TPA: flagellar motor switch phosphatase FliY, partial [Ruminococcaceae bacterium]|nr:flagellar motor switch phosphatase FliY [Oscillospiraceae bacterium]
MANDENIEFSSYEIDAVGEILNISMGSAATAVSELLNAKTWITTPQVKVVKVGDLNYDNLEPAICVKIVYVEGITGLNMMVLKQNDVQLILNQLLGNPLVIDPNFKFDELNISAVSEIMNQMMGASATALSDLLGMKVDISVPMPYIIEKTKFGDLCEMPLDSTVVAVTFKITVEGVMESEFMSVLSLELAKTLSGKMMEKFSASEEAEAPAAETTAQPASQPAPAPQPAPAAQPAPAPAPEPNAMYQQ